MLRRLAYTPRWVARPAQDVLDTVQSRHSTRACGRRFCSTKAESAAGAKVEQEAAEPGAQQVKPSAPRPPHRKDWRTHKDIVYVKGVPAKGNLFKLPWPEQLLICIIFAVAGTGAVYMVRPQIRYLCHHGFLGLTDDAGWVNGPWLYRLLYVLIMFPAYSLILFITGGFFGRRIWFSFMIHKMWSRFLTKKAGNRLAYALDIQHY